jgi:hypothetical protein
LLTHKHDMLIYKMHHAMGKRHACASRSLQLKIITIRDGSNDTPKAVFHVVLDCAKEGAKDNAQRIGTQNG